MTSGETTAARRDLTSVCRALAADVKLSHSVFALPFALLAAFMARPETAPWTQFGGQALLVVACMVCARTFAMLMNRVLDAKIDAGNPRTAGRAIPSGRVTRRDAGVALVISALAFVACCSGFLLLFGNAWPVMLALPVLLWIGAYPLLKRATWLCHLYLGSSLAISPLAAALAVEPTALAQPALWMLSANVLCWVAGFDIIYALQDVDLDRRDGLHSIPSRLGVERGLWISRGLHALAVTALILMVVLDPRLGWLFGVGVALIVGLLIVEHRVTAGGATGKIQLAFFTLNGVISCVLGTLGIISILIAAS